MEAAPAMAEPMAKQEATVKIEVDEIVEGIESVLRARLQEAYERGYRAGWYAAAEEKKDDATPTREDGDG